MTTKSMAYDNPAYLARAQMGCDQQAAGASKSFNKFLAFTAMKIYSIGAACLAAGTSSYSGWNGTATVTNSTTADAITAFKVNAGGTSTYGPYVLDGGVNSYRQIQLSGTGVGSSTADGGITLAQGDQFYVQRGTDATAVQCVSIEYGIAPLAAITN